MKTMVAVCAGIFLVGTAVSAAPVDRGFDMGGPDTPLAEGFVRVTPDDIYTPSRGYGFAARPAASFDRERSRCKAEWYQTFWGVEVVGDQPYYGEPVAPLWRDGVRDRDDIVFRVDVPDGVWNVWVTLGDEEWTRLDMNVAAEGDTVLSDIRTWIFWGAYPAHRRVKFRVEVTDGVLDLRFFNHGKDIPVTLDSVETVHEVVNSVLAVELQRHEPPRLSLADGVLAVEASLDSPDLRTGFDLYRAGRLDDALDTWRGIESDEARGILFSWVAGVVPREDTAALLDSAVVYLDRAAKRAPGDRSIALALQRTERFREGLLRFSGVMTREFIDPNGWIYKKRYRSEARDLLLEPAPDEPFHLEGRMVLAKSIYWGLRESGGRDLLGYNRQEFVDETMRMVLDVWPDYDTAKIYAGRKVPWGAEFANTVEGAPHWASLARELLSRQHAILTWWADHQAPDGSMGGAESYGDDVEMLRNWPGVLLATGDPKIVRCMERLADAVYERIAPRGYNENIWDVQHSAEPTGDPAFITRFDYGDPKHVERQLMFMALMRDVFTGINERGDRHFKSLMMGAEGVVERPPFAIDTWYHVRAAKPGLWCMWYTGLPEAERLFAEWADAWAADAMRTDRGKPAGSMPAIAWPTGRVGGYGPDDDWTKTASGYDYYDWGENQWRLYEMLYTMWRTVGKDAWLEPMFTMPSISTVVMWRNYTGDTSHDDLFAKNWDPYGRFRLTGDTAELEKVLERSAASLRYNFPLMTSEVEMTDRITIGDTRVITGMYSGGTCDHLTENLPYSMGPISWTGTGTDYAALVRDATPASVRLGLFSFYEAGREVGMRFWNLDRGRYEIRMGDDTDDDGVIDGAATVMSFTHERRGDEFRFVMPSRRLVALDIRMKEALPPAEGPLPDIAFTADDLSYAREEPSPGRGVAVSVLVHNIGGSATGPVTVTLAETSGDACRILDTVRFPGLDAPHDFTPKTEPVALSGYISPGAEAIVISAEPDKGIDEICLTNNEVTVPLER